jgi:hypothetical protein
VREQGIEEPNNYGEQSDENDLTFDKEAFLRDIEYVPETAPAAKGFDVDVQLPWANTLDPDVPVRLQAIAIAASSFGAAGCFDDDLLLRRSEVVRNYITNGYE